MQLHRRFGGAKFGPREHRQTQIDRRGIECVNGVRQLDSKTVRRVQGARSDNQTLGELGVDAPVSTLVGVGQRRTSHWLRQPHMIKLARLRTQTCFDIAQTLAVRQLCKRHHAKLFDTRQRSHPVVGMMPLSDAVESFPRQKVHHLREQSLAKVHRSVPPVKACTLPNLAHPRSNRGQPVSSITACHDWAFRQSCSS